MDVTIKRSEWLHGDSYGGKDSALYCRGKSCCLGHVLAAGLEVPRVQLEAMGTPFDLVDYGLLEDASELPESVRFLLDERGTSDSLVAEDLMSLNDEMERDESCLRTKERLIADTLAAHGVNVTFTD